MKKTGVVLLGIVTCFVLTNSVMADIIAPPNKLDGGYSAASVTDKEVIAAADFAIKAEEKALQELKDSEPAKLELVKIVSARQQVLAGTNYRLKLKVKLDGKEKVAEVVVWHEVRRNPDPYKLRSWTWK